jgi:hypothetical protein
MITRENLNHGEGELVEDNPDIGLRKRTSQSEKIALKRDFLMRTKSFERLSSPCRRW